MQPPGPFTATNKTHDSETLNHVVEFVTPNMKQPVREGVLDQGSTQQLSSFPFLFLFKPVGQMFPRFGNEPE